MIQLIRDDIYTLLARTTNSFSGVDRAEQKQHIDVFRESARIWRSWQGALNGQTIYRYLEYGTAYDERMKTLRTQCERLLREKFQRPAEVLSRSLLYTLNRTHDYTTEWAGPLLRDDNDRATDRTVDFGWMDRRNGYWFLQEEGKDQGSQGVTETVGLAETDDEREYATSC
jgi:hypothetical protein